jgi:hypothetical protein
MPPNEPQTPSPLAAASCRGPGMPVPRARHGHAVALEDQNPRACARTRTANPSRAAARCLGPSLALPRARAATAVATPRPRHGLAVRGDHVPPPRHRVRIAAGPLGIFLEHPSGVRTRTRATAPARTHTRPPHWIQPMPLQIPPRPTRGTELSAREEGKEAAQPEEKKEERAVSPLRPKEHRGQDEPASAPARASQPTLSDPGPRGCVHQGVRIGLRG